jgi:hypothetical protein
MPIIAQKTTAIENASTLFHNISLVILVTAFALRIAPESRSDGDRF